MKTVASFITGDIFIFDHNPFNRNAIRSSGCLTKRDDVPKEYLKNNKYSYYNLDIDDNTLKISRKIKIGSIIEDCEKRFWVVKDKIKRKSSKNGFFVVLVPLLEDNDGRPKTIIDIS